MIDYALICSQSYDHIIKYLLKDQIIVDKTNVCGLWTNRRKLQFRDGCVEYFKMNEETAKMSVSFENCNSAEYSYSAQDQSFNFTFIFTEKFCKERGQIRSQNSSKIIRWTFKTKIKEQVNNIKLKIQQYERKWLLFYLQSSKSYNEQKQFYQEFSNYCVKSVELYKLTNINPTKDLKIELLTNQQTNFFKQYQKITNLISQIRFAHEVFLITPLYCKVMRGNEIHLCQLLINDEFQQQNELIQQQISEKEGNDIELKVALQNFSVQYYYVENIIKYGLLVSKNSQSAENNQNLTQNQILTLNQSEVYDTENLTSILHKNKLKIRQIGLILQSQDIKNLDLKKLCKAEIMARSLKTYLLLKSKNYDKSFFIELVKGFLVKPINQNIQDVFFEMEKQIHKKFFPICEQCQEFTPNKQCKKFSLIFNKICKEVFTKEILILNSLMYHLNFLIPIKITELLVFKDLNQCFDYESLRIITKCKSYFGNQPQTQEGDQLNYQYLEKKKIEYLKENRQVYVQLTSCYLGSNNSLKARFFYDTNQNNSCDKISLEKAQQILIQIQPFSPLLDLIKKRLNENSNQETTIVYTKESFIEICQSNLSEKEREKKILDLTLLEMEDQSNQEINLSITQSPDNLKQMHENDIIKYAEEKFKKKRFDHALQILEILNSKFSKEALILGYKCEKQMNIKEKVIYSYLLLNYFLIHGEPDYSLIWEIFLYEMRNIITYQINFDADFYFSIYDEQKVCQNWLQVVKKLYNYWITQYIESLKVYAQQQFDVLNENKRKILQNFKSKEFQSAAEFETLKEPMEFLHILIYYLDIKQKKLIKITL